MRSNRYEVTRKEVLAPFGDPEKPKGHVAVYAADYAPPHEKRSEPPLMSLPMAYLTRAEWEELKRLGDAAWEQWERDYEQAKPIGAGPWAQVKT